MFVFNRPTCFTWCYCLLVGYGHVNIFLMMYTNTLYWFVAFLSLHYCGTFFDKNSNLLKSKLESKRSNLGPKSVFFKISIFPYQIVLIFCTNKFFVLVLQWNYACICFSNVTIEFYLFRHHSLPIVLLVCFHRTLCKYIMGN